MRYCLLCLLVALAVATAFFHAGSLRPAQANRGALEMRGRTCDLSGKRRNGKAMSVSKSNAHTHRVQNINLQTCKLWWEEGKKFVRLRLAAKTLRTVKKNGLHRVAKEYGINLDRFAISSGTGPKKVEAATQA